MEIIGLLAPGLSLPLIKPVCGDQAPAQFKSCSEGWFRVYGFHSCVDHSGADGAVLRPERYQSPVAFLEVPAAFVLNDDGYLLGGCDVVARLEVEGNRLNIKKPPDVLW